MPIEGLYTFREIKSGQFFWQNGILCVKTEDGRAFGMNSHGPFIIDHDKRYRIVEPEEAWKRLDMEWESYQHTTKRLYDEVNELKDRLYDLGEDY